MIVWWIVLPAGGIISVFVGFKELYPPALGRLVAAILQLLLPRPLSSLVFGFSGTLDFTELKRPH